LDFGKILFDFKNIGRLGGKSISLACSCPNLGYLLIFAQHFQWTSHLHPGTLDHDPSSPHLESPGSLTCQVESPATSSLQKALVGCLVLDGVLLAMDMHYRQLLQRLSDSASNFLAGLQN